MPKVRCNIPCKHKVDGTCGRDEILIGLKGCESREGKTFAAAAILWKDMKLHAAQHGIALRDVGGEVRLLGSDLKDSTTDELLAAFIGWLHDEAKVYRPQYTILRFHQLRYRYINKARERAKNRIDPMWLR